MAVQPPVPEHPFSKKALSKRGVAVRGCVWGGVPVRKKFGHRESKKQKKTRDLLKKCVLCETVTKNNTKNLKMKRVSEIWWCFALEGSKISETVFIFLFVPAPMEHAITHRSCNISRKITLPIRSTDCLCIIIEGSQKK